MNADTAVAILPDEFETRRSNAPTALVGPRRVPAQHCACLPHGYSTQAAIRRLLDRAVAFLAS